METVSLLMEYLEGVQKHIANLDIRLFEIDLG